jgi:toxin YoeB
MINVFFAEKALKDYKKLAKTNKELAKRVAELVKEIEKDPKNGTGKPEKLKYRYAGCWSRRIDREHRLIYRIIDDENVMIYSCYGHYEKY